MHSLDPLLKGLILKVAIMAACAVTILLTIPLGILITSKATKGKPLKSRLLTGLLITPPLFLVVGYCVVSAGFIALNYWVVQPAAKRDCVQMLRHFADEGAKWAATHNGQYPSDFGYMTELSIRSIRHAPNYEIVTPAIKAGDTTRPVLRCKTDGHLAYTDGTVFDGSKRD
jgi:hypothetical protein